METKAKKTADDLPAEQRASYSAIIDDVLANADLESVSAKFIRKRLQERVEYEIAPQKEEITDLIMLRFDRFQREREPQQVAAAPPAATGPTAVSEPAPTTNGAPRSASPPPKRKASCSPDEDVDDSDSAADSPPPPRKKPKPSQEETDEQMAKRMQAELNAASGRATRRGGSAKKKTSGKKDMTAQRKKKSKAKVASDDDSDVDGSRSGSGKPEKEKKGGFHKPLTLSPALSDLLGETQLSRPQTVKKIWAYIRANDLQNPSDKREIRCDEKMRTVFGKDKVHMFTMNKILGSHLYAEGEI